MTYYYIYNEQTKGLTLAPRVITMPDGSHIANPTAAQYAAICAYPRAADDTMPVTPQDKVAVPDGWQLCDGAWQRTWRFVDRPQTVRTWTRLSLIRACGEMWPEVKAALVNAGLYDEFIGADEIREDDPAFRRGAEWARGSYGDEAVDAILAAAEAVAAGGK